MGTRVVAARDEEATTKRNAAIGIDNILGVGNTRGVTLRPDDIELVASDQGFACGPAFSQGSFNFGRCMHHDHINSHFLQQPERLTGTVLVPEHGGIEHLSKGLAQHLEQPEFARAAGRHGEMPRPLPVFGSRSIYCHGKHDKGRRHSGT